VEFDAEKIHDENEMVNLCLEVVKNLRGEMRSDDAVSLSVEPWEKDEEACAV
jgi:hypothetical protein